MRRLLGMLRTGNEDLALAPQPGMEHLDLLVEHVRTAGVPSSGVSKAPSVRLPAGVDLAAYRVIQESLTNVLKHAGPASATVTVRYRAGRARAGGGRRRARARAAPTGAVTA